MTTQTIEAPETTATEVAEEHRTEDLVLEIPLPVAVQSAAAMLTSASKDEDTPVLTSAHFDGTELVATDRHKVARFPLPTTVEEERRLVLGGAFLIPRDALEWAAKLVARSLRHKGAPLDGGYTVRYERDADANTVSVAVIDAFGKVERSQAFEGVTGNFPPVSRLFGQEPATSGKTQGFSPAFMGVILAYCSKFGGRDPFKITLNETPSGLASPALIEGAGAMFLLQPNTLP